MNKKILIALLVLSQSFSFAFADIKTYSKYEFLKLTEQNNFNLSLIQDQLETEKEEYLSSVRTKLATANLDPEDTNKNYDTAEAKNALANILEYNPIAEGKEYFDKEIEYKEKKASVLLDAEKLFFNYIISKENLEVKKSNFDFAKEKLASKELEFELGKISQLDLLSAKKTYNDSYVSFLTANNEYLENKNSINKTLNIDINSDFDIAAIDVPTAEYTIENLEEMKAKLLENSYQIKTLEMEKERLEADIKVKNRFSGYGNYKTEINQLNDSLKETISKIDDAKIDVAYQLYTKYNDLISSQNQLKSVEAEFEIQKNNYNVSKIKFENGMASSFDYIESKNAYDTAWNNYRKEKVNSYSKVKEFENFIKLNTTIVKMDLK